MIEDLAALLQRDLASLRREIGQYPDDASLWRPLPGTSNAGGTLALHVAGNLQTYVGAQLAHTGYVRDRDREFAVRGLSREAVIAELDAASRAVAAGMEALRPADLDREVPAPRGDTRLPLRQLLLHLAAHLAYHLGQVDYHRRALPPSA